MAYATTSIYRGPYSALPASHTVSAALTVPLFSLAPTAARSPTGRLQVERFCWATRPPCTDHGSEHVTEWCSMTEPYVPPKGK